MAALRRKSSGVWRRTTRRTRRCRPRSTGPAVPAARTADQSRVVGPATTPAACRIRHRLPSTTTFSNMAWPTIAATSTTTLPSLPSTLVSEKPLSQYGTVKIVSSDSVCFLSRGLILYSFWVYFFFQVLATASSTPGKLSLDFIFFIMNFVFFSVRIFEFRSLANKEFWFWRLNIHIPLCIDKLKPLAGDRKVCNWNAYFKFDLIYQTSERGNPLKAGYLIDILTYSWFVMYGHNIN